MAAVAIPAIHRRGCIMVQVDVFWGYGWGAVMAAAAGKQLLKESRPFYSEFFVKTLLFLSLFWAPTGMLLLIQHPSWETMQVATGATTETSFYDMPVWLVLAFGLTNITQGILGFWVGLKLLQNGRDYLLQLNWLLGYYGMFFILLYGWDGLGYDRFLYDRDMLAGSPAWVPGVATGVTGILSALGHFLTSSVAITLYTDGAWLLPPFFLIAWQWCRRNGSPISAATWIIKQLLAVFVVGLGAALVSALVVNYTGMLLGIGNHVARALGQTDATTSVHVLSYVIGLPLSWAALYVLLFKPGRPVHGFMSKVMQ